MAFGIHPNTYVHFVASVMHAQTLHVRCEGMRMGCTNSARFSGKVSVASLLRPVRMSGCAFMPNIQPCNAVTPAVLALIRAVTC